ncbi:MAG: phosphotransferase [Novosphingobium sp.]|nr:phosphotransferase [Novosphingobium sp.]MCP5401267.1 phosphotransferase [Novosphingobium sp.]
MTDVRANKPARELDVGVPETLDAALDAGWLSQALGARVTTVEQVELIKTVATKVRFAVTFEGSDEKQAFCLKGLLDVDEMTKMGGSTCVLEGDFYCRIAPKVDVRVPEAVAVVTDREAKQSVLIMRDLIAGGARFCSALEPFTADQAAESVEQIARLHAGSDVLGETPWIRPRAAELARMPHMTAEILQELLDGPRGDNLTPEVRNGARLIEGMKALADRNEKRPEFLVHGDAHAGNIFRTSEGPGLIDWQVLQRGSWAVDVAYHLCAVLPVELAEQEERRLLGHYLDLARGLGLSMPDEEEAWLLYREAVMYGFYLWGITRRVDPEITIQFTDRLGRAVMRHESHALLGVA